MDKKELRKYIRGVKKQFTPEELRKMSYPLCEKLERNEHFQKAHIVLGYWSMEDEVYTHEFITKWAREKTILLPCVCGNELELRRFECAENLCPGESYDIPEPVGEVYSGLDKIDFVIVPGMAFDAWGNRLGRGKGYYDRILKDCPAYKAGLCFAFQFVEHVPTDEYDVRVDTVIK